MAMLCAIKNTTSQPRAITVQASAPRCKAWLHWYPKTQAYTSIRHLAANAVRAKSNTPPGTARCTSAARLKMCEVNSGLPAMRNGRSGMAQRMPSPSGVKPRWPTTR